MHAFLFFRSIVAIAGEDFAVIAADTRLSSGYSIHTRAQNKLFKLTDSTVLGSAGCWCDTLALTALVQARLQMYEHTHLKKMTTEAIAQMLSIVLEILSKKIYHILFAVRSTISVRSWK